MPTTKDDIRRWFERGLFNGNTHLIVVCDTYDYTDFPKYYTGSGTDARDYVSKEIVGQMQKVMEVYDLRQDFTEQVNRFRCFEFGE